MADRLARANLAGMFARIVVAHDGTQSGDAALQLALRLRADDGRLILAHVHAFREATRAADVLQAACDSIPDEIEHECRVIDHASITHALADLAESENADLLVIGPSHRTRFGRAVLNTTGQRLLHGAPCPIAIATYGGGALRRIGVAYDGSPEAEIALQTAYALAEHAGTQVRLYRVFDEIEAIATEVTEQAAARAPDDLEVDVRFLEPPAADVLPATAARECDLLLTGSRGHGPVLRVFLGSVSSALAGAAVVPVLVTPRGAGVELASA